MTPVEHEHQWNPDPEISGNAITRYRCACGAFGWRKWPSPGGHVPPIRFYARGFDVDGYREEVYRGELSREESWRRERRARQERGLEP